MAPVLQQVLLLLPVKPAYHALQLLSCVDGEGGYVAGGLGTGEGGRGDGGFGAAARGAGEGGMGAGEGGAGELACPISKPQ
jgi:hypothetical protein